MHQPFKSRMSVAMNDQSFNFEMNSRTTTTKANVWWHTTLHWTISTFSVIHVHRQEICGQCLKTCILSRVKKRERSEFCVAILPINEMRRVQCELKDFVCDLVLLQYLFGCSSADKRHLSTEPEFVVYSRFSFI